MRLLANSDNIAAISRGEMRCIFCKSDSSNSKSVEHIIPESLGNTEHVLQPGIVCDACNNYFARKVEKPLLDTPYFRSLRFEQLVPSKKNRVPSVNGVLPLLRESYEVHRDLDGQLHIPMDAKALSALVMKQDEGRIYIARHMDLPSGSIVSRFLAKSALEALALRLQKVECGLEWIVSENQFDMFRNHARRGEPRTWPYHARTIYEREASDGNEQILHEFDILVTDSREFYFVLAIFGVEFSINYGGPDIGGYHQWLKENDERSLLYCGKNRYDSRPENGALDLHPRPTRITFYEPS